MRVVIGETPDAQRYHCFLDGQDISNRCYAADDEEGTAWCYVRDDAGRLVLNAASPAEPLTERLTGTIRLERMK